MGATAADTRPAKSPPLGAALDAGDLAQLMSVFNDVTSRLHETHDRLHREVTRLRSELNDANEQLQRSRRLAALGQMAAGIAHEVRNPLGSIRLYARMLEEDLADQPEQRRVAGRIADAVVGLDAVVGDVLSFARELEVRCERVEASALVHRSLDAALPPGGPPNLSVIAPTNEGVCLECDPRLVQQALVNVIRNAAEAMSEVESDAHELRVEVVRRVESDREGVILSVSDTGPGIPDEVVDRMFNPFFTTRHSGTGLGLAIVHRIVDAHGGRIVVRSRTAGPSAVDSGPRGTTIELHLPLPGAGQERESATGQDGR